MHRFFIEKDQLPHIYGEDVHHIRDVLRMRPGEKIELLDGQGKAYSVKIDKIEKDKITCKILSVKESAIAPNVRIILAQCLPKAKKMDWIIQKSAELGVWRIIPVISERTIAKGEKPARWQSIAKEAAQQCGLPFIPEVKPLIKFDDLIFSAKNYNLALIPWELEQENTLKKSLLSCYPDLHSRIPRYPDILILIGPEGGFSQKEILFAKKAGFISVSLGPRILRTETVGIAMLSMINYEFAQ
ncbi:MAG: 16S rRNA (uracil(1498)-N(3))-methyltransferase [Candidatus Margulisbacteria bacterium]|nr:16S rRNA (uracil(1498)-N(3))-methyltransferase [Candidatus Margulisiibacteriota bacterium]